MYILYSLGNISLYPCLPGVSNSGTTLMPLILAASIICVMFVCEYTCVFGLNEPFWLKEEDKRVDWELIVLLSLYKIHQNTTRDTYKHIYIMYLLDSFNSLEQFVMHSTSDGLGFWNRVLRPEIINARNRLFFILMIFQSVARLRFCITHHNVLGEPKKLYFHGHNFGVSSKIHCLKQ